MKVDNKYYVNNMKGRNNAKVNEQINESNFERVSECVRVIEW